MARRFAFVLIWAGKVFSVIEPRETLFSQSGAMTALRDKAIVPDTISNYGYAKEKKPHSFVQCLAIVPSSE